MNVRRLWPCAAGLCLAFMLTPVHHAHASPLTEVDATIKRGEEHLREAKECFKTLASLEAGLAGKKKALQQEFNGRIPPSFNNLLLMKQNRINRQRGECLKKLDETGKILDMAHQQIVNVEPKNLSGINERRESLAFHRKQLNLFYSSLKARP